jgi:hypothetical protein
MFHDQSNRRIDPMRKRLTGLGYALVAVGLIFMIAGGVAYTRVQDGYSSLEAFSLAQDVQLSYNEDNQLIDRGTTEGADAIMATLVDDWNYPVVQSDLDPNDPLVNTGTEYMFQMATVSFHVLNGTQTVVVPEDIEYNGEFFAAGTYDFEVGGKYWTDFDRSHPLEGPAREQAWSGTVHGLIGELGVGTVTHSTLQMGLAMAGLFAGLGATLMMTGFGLSWAMAAKKEVEIPDTVPEAFTRNGETSKKVEADL